MLHNSESEHHQTNLLWLVCCALCYSLALSLTIHGASLWTDEAFSAYIACQRTFGSLVATLLAGDSSDLQMAIYYIYLHFWTLCFGSTEFALRAANIPFAVVFSFAFVWTSWRVFHSRWIWMAPACFPFLLLYGREARAYFVYARFRSRGFICGPAVVVSAVAWGLAPASGGRQKVVRKN